MTKQRSSRNTQFLTGETRPELRVLCSAAGLRQIDVGKFNQNIPQSRVSSLMEGRQPAGAETRIELIDSVCGAVKQKLLEQEEVA